jgi:hypothetical protein
MPAMALATTQAAATHRPLRNPDFDDPLVIWNDAYSGRYPPVTRATRFADQWRFFWQDAVFYGAFRHGAAWIVLPVCSVASLSAGWIIFSHARHCFGDAL